MAKAPIYEPGSVQLRSLPSTRLTAGAQPASFGAVEAQQTGQLGDALSQVADNAAKIVIATQDRNNKSITRDLYTKAAVEMDEFMITDIRARKGGDALNAHRDAELEFEKIRKKHASGLRNNAQRELFKASFDARVVGNLSSALRHQEAESQRFMIATLKAENLQVGEYAALNMDDPEAIRVAEETIVANTRFLNSAFPGPIKDQAVADAVDALYTKVMDSLTLVSPSAALAFFERNEDKFNQASRIDVKNNLEVLAERDQIDSAVSLLSKSGIGLEEQLEMVDSLISEQEKAGRPISRKGQKELRSLVKGAFNEKEMLRKLEGKKQIDALYTEFFDAVTNNETETFVIPITAPSAVRNRLKGLRKEIMQTNLWLAGKGPKPDAVTDPTEKLRLMAMSREELNGTNPTEWKLAGNDWIEVYKHALGLDRGSKNAFEVNSRSAQIRDFMNRSSYLTQGVVRFGLDLSEDEIEDVRSQFAEWIAGEVERMGEDSFKPTELRERMAIGMEDITVRIPPKDEDIDPLRVIGPSGRGIIWETARGIGRQTFGVEKKIKRFQLPFADKEIVEAHRKAKLREAPVGIRGIPGLGFDENTRTFYAEILGENRVFDADTGEHIDTFSAEKNQEVNGVVVNGF